MLEDAGRLRQAACEAAPDVVVHLAAQAGVRHSLENPRAYIDSNLIGSFNLLEVVRELKVRHLIVASTSSVYGANAKIPFTEVDGTDEPMTLYAASKKAVEAMAHAYSHLHDIPTTAVRFFTVYGPWGRPDMALFKFVAAALRGEAIDVYGEGRMERDFTYVDDLVEAIARVADAVPAKGRPVTFEGARTACRRSRRTGPSISVAGRRSGCCPSSTRSNGISGCGWSGACCRCSRGMCPPPSLRPICSRR